MGITYSTVSQGKSSLRSRVKKKDTKFHKLLEAIEKTCQGSPPLTLLTRSMVEIKNLSKIEIEEVSWEDKKLFLNSRLIHLISQNTLTYPQGFSSLGLNPVVFLKRCH